VKYVVVGVTTLRWSNLLRHRQNSVQIEVLFFVTKVGYWGGGLTLSADIRDLIFLIFQNNSQSLSTFVDSKFQGSQKCNPVALKRGTCVGTLHVVCRFCHKREKYRHLYWSIFTKLNRTCLKSLKFRHRHTVTKIVTVWLLTHYTFSTIPVFIYRWEIQTYKVNNSVRDTSRCRTGLLLELPRSPMLLPQQLTAFRKIVCRNSYFLK
jgi:hypothetical protein